MKTQDKFIMGSFITRKTGQDFYWGINDCNTFFIELHDELYGTDDLKRVKEQYANRPEAVKFMKNLGLTPAQWLHMRNYRKLEDKFRWTDGDVGIIQHKVFASVYVYFNGAFWTVPEGEKMKGYNPKAFKDQPIVGFRKNG